MSNHKILLQRIEIHFITHTIAEIYLAFPLFTKGNHL